MNINYQVANRLEIFYECFMSGKEIMSTVGVGVTSLVHSSRVNVN
jgi:hypothetical protein